MYTSFVSYQSDREAYMAGKLSVSERLSVFLQRISDTKSLNIFIEDFREEAMLSALESDKRFSEGKARKLEGMVIALKDNISYKGHTVTASSKMLEGYISVYSATVVERLLDEGAIIIGRVGCDEFAMGSSNETSIYGSVKNPYDVSRVPGGSSGGSAAAVAAGTCHVAFGSDTGGSIRQPAAFCGLVGMKPTYGRVSRWGLIAYGSSFDQIGPLSQQVEDNALVMEVISGADGKDATASQENVPAYTQQLKSNAALRLAYLPALLQNESIAEPIRKAYQKSLDTAREAGYTLVETSFDYFDYLVPIYYVLTTAEASSNLSRFDGIRYGHRTQEEVADLDMLYKKSRSEGFGWEVKRRIMLGTFVLSSGFYDAYYSKAQKARMLIKQETDRILEQADILLLPSITDTAFMFGENSDDPVKMYLQDIFTVQANVTGHPALAFPTGKDEKNLPLGMQLMGKKFHEAQLYRAAKDLMFS